MTLVQKIGQVISAGLLTGWIAAAAVYPDVLKLLLNIFKWNSIASRWSA